MNDYIRNTPQIIYAAARLAVDGAMRKAESIGVPRTSRSWMPKAIWWRSPGWMAPGHWPGAPKFSKARTAASLGFASGQLPEQFGMTSHWPREPIHRPQGRLAYRLYRGQVIGAVGLSSGSDDEDISVANAACQAIFAEAGS